jgi:hypothetical protein
LRGQRATVRLSPILDRPDQRASVAQTDGMRP